MLVCRLCLGEENSLKKIISVWSPEISYLPKRIKDCVSIDIQSIDVLPTGICEDCFQKIIEWEKFKATCQKSQEVLSIRNCFTIDNQKSTKEEENIQVEHKDELGNCLKDQVYTCDVCQKIFDSCFEYLDHQETHDGFPNFVCDKCNKVFDFRKDLLLHDRTHKSCCEICGKSVLETCMKFHLVLHTNKYRCRVCDGSFTCATALSNHVTQRHTEIKNFMCEFCGKSFSSNSLLKVHGRVHSEQRHFKCAEEGCNYAARTSAALACHRAKHSDEMRLCQMCPKVFKSNRHMRDHMRRAHCEIKKHQCSHCKKCFVDKHMLTVHLRWHTGDRKYKCLKCPKAFTRSDGLKEHLATHQPPTFHCTECGKFYSTKRTLKKHQCYKGL